MGMRNERGLHLCPNRKEKLHISTGMYCMYSSYAVYVVQHLMLISQKTLQVRLSSCHFSHIHLFIAVHHLWDLGRKLLNMVSTDTCTCIHQHYFSGVIVDLLFCLCLKEDEASWWRYQFNGHQVKHCCLNPSDICCEDCIHEQLYCDSSDVTAHKRNFTTEQLQDSGGGIILAHTSNKNQW